MSAENMEIVTRQVNTVDLALQSITVDSGVNNNSLETIIAVKCADPWRAWHVFHQRIEAPGFIQQDFD